MKAFFHFGRIRAPARFLGPADRHVEEVSVTAPSVITLNAVACAPAVNDFLPGYDKCHIVDSFAELRTLTLNPR
jgi:hypothetical protein